MNCKTRKISEYIIIFILSLFSGFGVSIHFYGKVWGLYTDNYIEPLGIRNLLIFVFTFALLFFLLRIFHKHIDKISLWISKREKNRLSKLKISLIIFLFITISWMPYLLSFAPASVLTDSLSSIRQIIYGSYSSTIPIVYTLFIKIFLWIGNLLGSINRGLFVYACLQYISLALACTSMAVWLYTHDVKTIIIAVVVLFYAVFPAFPAYAIIMWKDPFFSIALVALSFILLNNKSTWYQLLISVLVILFFRSNGLVVIAFLAVIMLVVKNKRLQGIICTLSLIFFLIISNALLNHLNVERRTEEALGIPLQQIAYTVIYDYDSLSDSELESISNIIPIDTIRSSYTPCLVDTIKWHEQFNKDYVRENPGDVLKLWISLLPKHFLSYVKAYALETYGFYMPFVQSDYGYIDIYISENELGIVELDLFERIFGISIKEDLLSFQPCIGSGTLVWLAFLGFAMCILNNHIKKIWFYLPGLLCWLSVMISTPVAFSLRYVFVLIMLVPVYILMPFVKLD